MLRPRLRIPRASRLWRPAIPCRSIHHVPKLEKFSPEQGVPGLLSNGGFDIAWTQYQQFVIEKLNDLTAGTEFEMQDALTIAKATAREPQHAPIFNYASMAHNNHLFFEGIANVEAESSGSTNEYDSDERIPPGLKTELETQFSSIETLRREFLATAMAMFGPGFVWLVRKAQSTELRILTTYLAGTPYTAGHWRRQGVDMNTQGGPTGGQAQDTVRGYMERQQTGAGADTGGRFVSAPGGTDVVPLLCLNTWEHVWLRDYGIGSGGLGGKRQYVQEWWRVIDWNKVESLANLKRGEFKMK